MPSRGHLPRDKTVNIAAALFPVQNSVKLRRLRGVRAARRNPERRRGTSLLFISAIDPGYFLCKILSSPLRPLISPNLFILREK